VFKAIKNYLKPIKKDLKEFQRAIPLKLEAFRKISSKERETYSKIWKALNQTNLESIESESANYPTEFSQDNLRLYFESTSNYKVITLGSLSNKDKKYLENIGFSLKYLELNREPINKEGIVPEDSEKDKKLKQLDRRYPGIFGAEYQQINFKQSLVKEGCICAVDPQTGKILSSNRSLFVKNKTEDSVFYRFVGNEVFYLLCGTTSFHKMVLYFPSRELIIQLYPSVLPRDVYLTQESLKNLKVYSVSSWEKIKTYLLNTGKIKTVALTGGGNTIIASYLGVILTGVEDLVNNGNVDKVDQFIVLPPCYFGNLNEIFPDIAPEKIRVIEKGEKISLMEEIINDNGFLFLPNVGIYLEEEFANHIYSVSLAKCSSGFLAEVEKAKQESFPLILVTVRFGGRRRWISQLEGIANIIKSLAEDFPQLGVVFDGISNTSDDKISEFEIDLIEKQKELVSKIASLLPQQVKVYDTIGCFMYESIVWAKAIDFYLAPLGSGLSKVQWIANKPGVTHENSLSWPQMKEMRRRSLLNPNPSDHFPDWPMALLSHLWHENGVMPNYVPRHCITDFPESKDQHGVLVNYDFDWRVAYEECLKLAKSLKRN
jgi:hypothetical protein